MKAQKHNSIIRKETCSLSTEGRIFPVWSKSCLNEAKEIYIALSEPAKTEMSHIKWFLLFSVEVNSTETKNEFGVRLGMQHMLHVRNEMP